MITKADLVTDNKVLAQLCRQWQRMPTLTLDSEFVRVNTFYPQLGLIQLCDGEHSHLIDPLAISDWGPFLAILRNPDIVKVLHSASEDLLAFDAHFGCLPQPLFDTQKAAAFLGHGASLSYQQLVATLLDEHVDKGETRSDWLRRPLSTQQLDYATLDVAWLPALYQQLHEQLRSAGRLHWCEQECESMLKVARLTEDESQWAMLYLNMGNAWRLQAPELVVLKALCTWREHEARRRDMPRPWVARDADLILLAQQQPESRAALRGINDLSPALARKASDETLDELLARISAVDSDAAAGMQQGDVSAALALNRPLTPVQRRTLKRCQAALRHIADDLQISVELLARKKQLIALVLLAQQHGDFTWPAELGGWRQTVLETALRQVLDSVSASEEAV